MYKVCNKCKRNLPLNRDYFYKDKHIKGGFCHTCKECLNDYISDINYYNYESLIGIYEEFLNKKDNLPNRIFSNKKGINIICKYVFEEKFQYTINEILNLKRDFYKENKLQFVLKEFGNSRYYLIKFLYPNQKINPWLYENLTPKGFFDDVENIKKALSWLVEKLFEDNIIKTINDIPKYINVKLFKKYKLIGLLANRFNNSPFAAINFLFPNRWYPWEFQQVTSNFWSIEENLIKATKWLFEEKLKVPIEDIPKIASGKLFIDHGLYAITENKFSDIIMITYPNRFYKWQFAFNNYWKIRVNRVEFVKDIVEKIEKINITDIPKFYIFIFRKYPKLRSMCYEYYHSVFDLFNDVYPNVFFKWEFEIHEWDDPQFRITSLKELIEQKEKISIEELPNKLNMVFLKNNYLTFHTASYKFYDGNLYTWINEVYPNKFKESDLFKNFSHGVKTDSKDESIINNFLHENCFENVEIIYVDNNRDKNYFFYDEQFNCNYIPDWFLLHNDKIYIIEYFGLYNTYSKKEYVINYNQKTKNKISFYKRYCNENKQYEFISIFQNQLSKKQLNKIFSSFGLLQKQAS